MDSEISYILSQVTFVVAVSDDTVLSKNLLCSPIFKYSYTYEIIIQRDFASASLAYNDAINRASGRYVIFVHQDVYLPHEWDIRLAESICSIEKKKVNWAVLGVYGVTKDKKKCGIVYSNGLQKTLGRVSPPVLVRTIDELLIVLDKKTAISFDDQMPGFHLYGTDICLAANAAGYSVLAISNFVIHNSLRIHRLDRKFWKTVRWMRSKWKYALPLDTPCIVLDRLWLSYALRYVISSTRSVLRKRVGADQRIDDLEKKSAIIVPKLSDSEA